MVDQADHSANYEDRDSMRAWLAAVKPATPRVVWRRCQRADWMLLLLDLWCSDGQLEPLRPQLQLAAIEIAERAVIVHTHRCGIMAVEAWGARWLCGADRTRTASEAAKAAMPFGDKSCLGVYAAYNAVQAAECAQTNYLGSVRNGALPQLRSVSHSAWGAACLAAPARERAFWVGLELSWQAKCLRRVLPSWPGDVRPSCVGSGDGGAGCGRVSGLPGGTCSRCGGTLLSSHGLEDAKRLQDAWKRQGT